MLRLSNFLSTITADDPGGSLTGGLSAPPIAGGRREPSVGQRRCEYNTSGSTDPFILLIFPGNLNRCEGANGGAGETLTRYPIGCRSGGPTERESGVSIDGGIKGLLTTAKTTES